MYTLNLTDIAKLANDMNEDVIIDNLHDALLKYRTTRTNIAFHQWSLYSTMLECKRAIMEKGLTTFMQDLKVVSFKVNQPLVHPN